MAEVHRPPLLPAMAVLLIVLLSMAAININIASAVRQFPEARLSRRSLLQSSHGNLIVDYIGASGAADLQFTDLPITASLQYILPLSFAIDADASGNVQNGNFAAFWASGLTPQAAQSFKQSNPNVRLLLSLAGFSQFLSDGTTRNVEWYDPSDTDTWISNAVSSISGLVSQYSLDGIDVDYENFPTSTTFTTCIGGLISQLKSSGTISVASVAPFGGTLSIYADLFANFGSSIDFVNYQFYADGLASQSDFVSRYNTVANSFDASKLLASVEAGGRGLQGTDFIGAAQQLSIPGIMIFSVDTDKGSGFSTEQAVASFLSS